MQDLRTIFHRIYTSILWSMPFIIGACSAPNKVDKTVQNPRNVLEQELNECKDNQERLYKLLQGEFIVHVRPEGDSVKQLWRSDVNGDSAMYVVRPLGEPSKDGYILQYGLFLTQLSNEPLSNFTVKIERISRDTFELWKYGSPKYTLEEILNKKLENDYSVKAYLNAVSINKYGTYIKESNTRFRYDIPPRKYPYAGNDSTMYFRGVSGYVDLFMEEAIATFYNQHNEYTHNRYNYNVRRHNIDLRKLCALAKEE